MGRVPIGGHWLHRDICYGERMSAGSLWNVGGTELVALIVNNIERSKNSAHSRHWGSWWYEFGK